MIISSIAGLVFALTAPATHAHILIANASNEWSVTVNVSPSVRGGLFISESPRSQITTSTATRLTYISERRPVLHEIESYRTLSVGWDGGFGAPALAWSADTATNFVNALGPEYPDPIAMISPSGEVGLYWLYHGNYLEVAFEEDGTCCLFAEGAGFSKINIDNASNFDSRVQRTLQLALCRDDAILAA